MKFNRKMKIKYAALFMIFTLSLVNIMMIIPKTTTEASQPIKSSTLSVDSISILIYSEYADTTSLTNQEFSNTLSAISTYYGPNYTYDILYDYRNLNANIFDYDVFLIPEQEEATTDNMTLIGTTWRTLLNDYTLKGGVVICLDYRSTTSEHYYGITRLLLDYSWLINFAGLCTSQSFNTIYLNNAFDALAWDISSSWTAPDGTISAPTSDGTIIVDDVSDRPVVVHKIYGQGHIVYCGFDFYNILPNAGKILANALRLTRHVVFDDSHSNGYEITAEINGFATDLVNKGFAVSTMNSFSASYLNASEVLVIMTAGTDYTTSEIDDIETYIDNENGVLVCTDYDHYGDETDGLIENFGFVRNKTGYIGDSDEYSVIEYWPKYNESNIKSHSITSEVIDIELYAGTAFTSMPSSARILISTDNDDSSIWVDSGFPAKNVPVAASLKTSKGGRLVVVGDYGFVRDSADTDGDGEENYYDSSNEIFLVNSIIWLSEAAYVPNNSTAIPSYPLEVLLLALMVSCAALLIFIYKKRR